jgi:hypothetical protein
MFSVHAPLFYLLKLHTTCFNLQGSSSGVMNTWHFYCIIRTLAHFACLEFLIVHIYTSSTVMCHNTQYSILLNFKSFKNILHVKFWQTPKIGWNKTFQMYSPHGLYSTMIYCNSLHDHHIYLTVALCGWNMLNSYKVVMQQMTCEVTLKTVLCVWLIGAAGCEIQQYDLVIYCSISCLICATWSQAVT